MEIIQKDNGRNGVFIAILDDEEIGEMTYVRVNKDIILINHTGVRSSHEGKGVGKQLIEKCVEFARDNEIKIIPQCAFARTMFDRYPDFADTKA